MPVSIPPVAPVAARPVAPAPAVDPNRPEAAAGILPAAPTAPAGPDFAQAVNQALDTVSGLENGVNHASRLAATGDLGSVSDYMIAASEAQLATEITVAIRDRAIAAFNDIMTMQI